MTTTAPLVDRSNMRRRIFVDVADPIGEDLISSERDVLLHYLNKMRDAVVAASEGLSDDQQHRPGVREQINGATVH